MELTHFNQFADHLMDWQREFGRHHLPWQVCDPYKIWLSEIMLQQTQVSTVLPYFERFLAKFPTIEALATAEESEVLHLWSGLGYYTRARNLHKSAQHIVHELEGKFPNKSKDLEKLPGIGRSTAAAIAAFAFHERVAILDGNVKRVLTRLFGVFGDPSTRDIEQILWRIAEHLLPNTPEHMPQYTQALMDFGSLLCKRNSPKCEICPFKSKCYAFNHACTHQLPTPKTRKPKPIREETWLWIERGTDKREIFLVQHQEQGIWGKLWTPPRLSTAPLFLPPAKKLTEFHHVFTHFILHANVFKFDNLNEISPIFDEYTQQLPHTWANLHHPNLPMPKAVTRLFDSFKP